MHDRRAWIAIGVIGLISVGLLVVWKVQGLAMRDDFVRALQAGDVHGLLRDLQGKVWTEEELATASVLKVPRGAGRERSVERAVHSLGRIMVSPERFSYQGTVRDTTTGFVHVFGYTRAAPHKWSWERLDPTSEQARLKQRMEQLESLSGDATEAGSGTSIEDSGSRP